MKKLEWTIQKSEYILETNFIKVRKDSCLNALGQQVPPYYVSEYPTWVAAIARTKDNQYILERSYRHALGQIHYEIPAGCVDSTDTTLQKAIERELLEETGYVFESIEYLGKTSANPATNNNLMHFFYADNGIYQQEPNLEIGESFETILVSLEKLIEMLRNQQFIQALHITAIYEFLMQKNYLKFSF